MHKRISSPPLLRSNHTSQSRRCGSCSLTNKHQGSTQPKPPNDGGLGCLTCSPSPSAPPDSIATTEPRHCRGCNRTNMLRLKLCLSRTVTGPRLLRSATGLSDDSSFIGAHPPTDSLSAPLNDEQQTAEPGHQPQPASCNTVPPVQSSYWSARPVPACPAPLLDIPEAMGLTSDGALPMQDLTS